MTEPAATASKAPLPGHEQGHPVSYYVKIWAILMVLLVVSVVGPMAEIRTVTLITAFGIAIVKAFLVAKHFMHVNLEKRWVGYLLAAMIALMLLFFGGTAPDVMKHDGARWENTAAKEAVHKGLSETAEHGGHHE